MDLKKAIVLVTGGSSGIGLATAMRLKDKGAQVAICARNEERLQKAAKETGAFAIQCDVSVENEVEAAVGKVIEEFGDYNVLINNAAYGYFSPLTEIDTDKFNDMIAVNLTGAMLMAKHSARHFVKKQYGTIVNISSTAGGKGFAGGTPYVASKFALGGMNQCWMYELRKSNIRVMQVNPSEVQTEFASVAGYEQKSSDRKLRGDEIAHVIESMLALDDRGFVTEVPVWATNPD